MFKIGEFSKMVRVSARMLRYYEQNGLLTPIETDRFTGYRLYSAAQLPLLNRITELRDMGFGVDEIKDILAKFNDAVFMQRALEKKQAEVQAGISAEQDKLSKLTALSGKIKKENINMIYDVELKELPKVLVLSLREIVPSGEAETEMWKKLAAFCKKQKIAFGGDGGYSIYHDEEHKDADLDIEIAMPVADTGKDDGNFKYKKLAAIPQAATIRFAGSYEGYSGAIEKLATWVESNGYEFAGTIRGFAIKTFWNTESMDDFLTELQVPVKKQ